MRMFLESGHLRNRVGDGNFQMCSCGVERLYQ